MATDSTSAVKRARRCLSETSSRSVTRSVTATHNFEVTDFSLVEGMGAGKCVSSGTFSVGGCPDGNGDTGDKDYLSVFLCFLRGTPGVRAKFSFTLLGKDDVVSEHTYTFESVGDDWGNAVFIEKSELQELLDFDGDCFTIRCVLTVKEETRTEEVGDVVVPQPRLQQDLADMLKNGEGTDVTFSVGGQLFHAHRCMLAARSIVFKAELFGTMKEKDAKCIKIKDMEPNSRHSYTSSTQIPCQMIAMQLTAGGFWGYRKFIEKSKLEPLLRRNFDCFTIRCVLTVVIGESRSEDVDIRLRLMCEVKLCHGVDAETVATTLVLAEQHNCAHLKDACLKFLASRDVLGVVLKTDGFKHLVASCPLLAVEMLEKIVGV
ncbi:hypothetical protein U9M48_033907 [Paspalum notatum var. saurae]|uniref:BTB domain-containing protein n=1 Tax=Paspalum notatum var. saurae TaxID=547442 RepID=A0AAQ3UB54_PASNO